MTAQTPDPADEEEPPVPGLVTRPPGPFLDLPLRWRWEATRRHPYYLHFWERARRFFDGPRGIPPAEQAFTELAVAVLASIGVSAAPVEPTASFDDLIGPDFDPAFLSGSCLPVPLRDLVSELVQQLPPAELAYLGHLFRTAVHPTYAVEGDDAHKSRQRLCALLSLNGMTGPGLDGYGRRPLFRINSGAAEETILGDVKAQLRRFRRLFAIPDRRVHLKKLPSYLEAWDLREGWTGSGYDRAAERPFFAVAAILKTSEATAVSRYKSAFRLVVGHPFTPPLWARVFLWPRVHPAFVPPGTPDPPTARRTRDPSPRPVPASSLGERGGEVVEAGSSVGGDVGRSDLVADLDGLIGHGLSDAAVAAALNEAGYVAVTAAEVAYYRSRRAELRGL